MPLAGNLYNYLIRRGGEEYAEFIATFIEASFALPVTHRAVSTLSPLNIHILIFAF